MSRPRQSQRSWLVPWTVGGALVLVLTACSEAGQGGTGSASEVPSVTIGADEIGSNVTDYLDYTGGTAGPADQSREPVIIGWVNQQGGQTDIGPGATTGVQTAVKYINAELGGIGGHPLKLETCYISTSEEQGQACGQEMINNDEISVVAVGAVAIGSQSLAATINGEKPMVYGVSIGSADATNKNGYALFGDVPHISQPYGRFAKEVLGAKTAAILRPELPGIAGATDGFRKGAEAAGLDTKVVTWNRNATDLVGPLTAAGAQSTDVILLNPDPKGCVNVAKALAQLNIDVPVISTPLCTGPQVANALGDLPQWYYALSTSLRTDTTDPSAVAYMKVAERYGIAQASADPWVPTSFAQVLTIARWLNAVGPDKLRPEAIAKQAAGFQGPMAYGAPTLSCGKYADAPAICNDQVKFFRYEGDGKYTPVAGWTEPIK